MPSLIRSAAALAAFFLPALSVAGGRSSPSFELTISSSALRAHVVKLSAITHRRQSDPAGYRAATLYVRKQFEEAGLPTAVQHFSFGRTGENDNVIATINENRAEIVVVGAHYDVAGETPGADDNASGVAGLIELARLMNAHRDSLPFQVQFVAFANEEPPFFRTPGMGSFHHAWMLYGKRRKVRLMISLESIGYFTDTENSQAYPTRAIGWFRPKRGNFISLVSSVGRAPLLFRFRRAFARVTDLPVETLAAPRFVKGVDHSDHLMYWRFGFPAMMVTDTAPFRNPNYHTAADRPETLDYDRMAEVVRGVAACLLVL